MVKSEHMKLGYKDRIDDAEARHANEFGRWICHIRCCFDRRLLLTMRLLVAPEPTSYSTVSDLRGECCTNWQRDYSIARRTGYNIYCRYAHEHLIGSGEELVVLIINGFSGNTDSKSAHPT